MSQCHYCYRGKWTKYFISGTSFIYMLGILVRLCKNLVLWLVVLVRVLLLGRYNMTRATLIKKICFHWVWLTVQRSSPLSSWQEAWQHAG